MTGFADPAEPTLCDVLDRLLSRGVVVRGELWLTVADVEVLFVGAHLLLCSPDALTRGRDAAEAEAAP